MASTEHGIYHIWTDAANQEIEADSLDEAATVFARGEGWPEIMTWAALTHRIGMLGDGAWVRAEDPRGNREYSAAHEIEEARPDSDDR